VEANTEAKAPVDYKYKLLVVGDPKIGKTGFIRRVTG
jgi:GTPase SAR1 family protein